MTNAGLQIRQKQAKRLTQESNTYFMWAFMLFQPLALGFMTWGQGFEAEWPSMQELLLVILTIGIIAFIGWVAETSTTYYMTIVASIVTVIYTLNII